MPEQRDAWSELFARLWARLNRRDEKRDLRNDIEGLRAARRFERAVVEKSDRTCLGCRFDRMCPTDCEHSELRRAVLEGR